MIQTNDYIFKYYPSNFDIIVVLEETGRLKLSQINQ